MAERRKTQSQPQSNDRESLMDLDTDLDLPSWPFEPTTLLPSSTSPLSHSLMQLSFPNPPSPLWFFEDAPLNDFFKSTNGFETTNDSINQKDNTIKKVQSSAPDGYSNLCPFRERMTQALRHLKQSGDQHILVQVWAPVKSHNKYVLSTSGQPFVLDPHSIGLQLYRTVSMMYMFSADEDSDVDLGLPGRVFIRKMPEWTPNVQFYSSKEYPRLNHARNFDVRGSLALPVFEPSDQSCVGVVELIMTSQKFKYAPEVDKLCKALETVNLKSYEIVDSPTVQIRNEGRQNALAEIIEILTTICDAHKLPLAQTWVPCMHHSVLAHGGGSQKSCSSFDGSCMGQVCMSTSDIAVYVVDSHMWGFRDACVEHHLQKGQGVAGQAFESRSMCFCRDITQFCKTEYPLVHYARLFELSGCLSVCLQSIYTGDDDYILEFFLPPQCKDENEQKVIVESILNLMNKWFRSLKMAGNIDLGQEGNFPNIIDVCVNDNNEQESQHICGQSCNMHTHRAFEGNAVDGMAKDTSTEKNVKKKTGSLISSNGKKPERKRGKAEKTISLEVLQQYFSGSLKDAAKALGVCPTTMKRICRQHGISRWPSRKINKVNRSLSKLKRVIDSVQGAEGAFNIPSFACQLPLPLSLDNSNQGEDNVKNSHQNILLDTDSIQHKSSQKVDPAPDKVSLKSSSSGEVSTEAPTSLDSFEETNQNVSFSLGNDYSITDPLEFNNTIPFNTSFEDMEPMLGGNLIEDAGSSKDLKNLFNCVVDCSHDENTAIFNNNTIDQSLPVVQGLRTVTIKANYREDIIRFRLPGGAGMIELNEEVSKRLKLEVGTFDIRYLDDDKEWVMLSCDADFRECLEVARLSGVHIIRLSVHDIAMFIGSSCGSTGGLSQLQ